VADFSTSVQPVVAQPMQPIRPTTINPAAMGIEGIGGILGSIAPGMYQTAMFNRELAIKNSIQSVQADYSQHLLQIADAVDQGKMSSVQAKMNARSLFYQYTGNYPNMTSELLQTHKDVMADAGLGSDISQGTEAEQLQRKMRSDAAGAGFIKPGATLEEANQGMAMYQQYQMSGAQLGMAQKQLEYQRGQIGLVKDNVDLAAAKQNFVTGGINQQQAKLDLAMKNQQFQSQNAIASGSQAIQWKLNQDLQSIDNDVQAGKLTSQQGQMHIQQAVAAVQSTISQVAPAASSEYINNVTSPIKTLATAYMDKISGKIDAQTWQNTIDAAQAHAQVNAVNTDPLFAKVSAMSKLFPSIVQPFQGILTNKIISNMGMNTGDVQGVPNTVDGSTDTQNYLKMMQHLEAQHINGNLPIDPQTQAEFKQGMHNLVAGTAVYGPTATDPTKLNDIVQHFASPEFGKYMSSSANASTIDPNDLTQVKNIINDQYTRVLMPLITSEFRNSQVQVGTRAADPFKEAQMAALGADEPNMEPTAINVHPTFNGAGVSFVANDLSNADARSKALDLNQRVAPVMNNLIRASANLEGTRDYQKSYDTLLGNIYQNMGLNSEGNPVDSGKGVELSGQQPQVDQSPTLTNPLNNSQNTAGGGPLQ
jgi:polyhydroxyalkanoate synthesis regulator phasin